MKGLMSIAVAFVLASASCDKCDYPWIDCETVNVDDVYWSAYANPESFDAALTTMEMHPRTSEVFERLANERFQLEIAKLREREQFEEHSPLWEQWTDEAIELHDQGVVLGDMMRAIDGVVPFASSESGIMLTFGKAHWEQKFGAGSWSQLVAQARSGAAPYEWEFHESRW